MKKFLFILQKEIRELLTPQMIIPFIVVIIVFYFFGQYATKTSKQQQSSQAVAVIDQDRSELSKNFISTLSQANLDPRVYQSANQDLPEIMRKDDITFGIIIPSGFAESVANFQPKKIESYTLMKSFSIVGASKYAALDKAGAIVNEKVSNLYLSEKVPNLSPSLLKSPIQANSHSIINNSVAQVNPVDILGFLAKQSYLVPVILFIVIIIAAQMIATSIASEKENKTLETLLTAPINRKVLVVAKMFAAGIVALLMSVVYLVGFRSYLTGTISGASLSGQSIDQASLQSLGLVLTPGSYLLLGLVIFFGILVALAIAMIIGAFAEDVKSVQAAIAPLMVLVLIPYFATMFLDVSALPTTIRYIIYAIPFSHVFMAMPNLYLHNNLAVAYGILYELIIFIIFVWIASWIFSTDKILTMKWNFSKKRK